ncbi:MAG: PTS glucitol/sorbitol transporter subunit IIA, partial [Staphylococcus epidermidis]|nr:PTS glucitol/sorbitol transporter subunit IIA [Staphylococcus epidermidis]
GTSVNKNLRDLGHITIKFDGSISAEQSGTLYVENKEMPKIQEGTVIKIEN